MSDVAIAVENLGKQYRIGTTRQSGGRYRYKSLRDTVAGAALAPVRLLRGHRSRSGTAKSNREDTFWALKDVSFAIKRGEVVGIIGRNGAGKSTLLKILSRITEPTAGRVQIRGRVASLLEIGTGFHPELTGRENIFMNGAILGMSRLEIEQKFDEIVAFAEVDKFLDTAVKHYSSGMYVRLAFAVAAHIEPEILVVDEVLAVGDAQFQKKCLGKMQDVSRGGRTVLFVSHNMAAIKTLCPRAILLDRGALTFIGSSSEATARYLSHAAPSSSLERQPRSDGIPTITSLEITRADCTEYAAVELGLEITSKQRARCSIEIKLFDAVGTPLAFGSAGLFNPADVVEISPGTERFHCSLKLPRLAAGTYRLSVQLATPNIEVLDTTGDGISFELQPAPPPGYQRILDSAWGYGSIEFAVRVERLPRIQADNDGVLSPASTTTFAPEESV